MDLREKIQSIKDTPPAEKVPCPEWECDIYIRVLEGGERDFFEESLLIKKGKKREVSLKDFRAKLVMLCACDAEGKPVFRQGDEKWLTQKSAVVLDRLFTVAQKVNALKDEDIEEMVGNS